ncbi:Prefoldin beta-like protein [Mycena leptocephala]|nr:Prefoldin beta-like protein [Mycena leptocephala]
MSSAATKAKAKTQPFSDQEISQNYSRMQNELQGLAGKIGELEQEADEHSLVLTTLNEALAEEPDRKCFRLIGGVLVERTVKDVVPTLQSNRTTYAFIKKVVGNLTEQYKSKEEEFDTFKREYNIRPAARG